MWDSHKLAGLIAPCKDLLYAVIHELCQGGAVLVALGQAKKFRLAGVSHSAPKVVAWKMCQCTLYPYHLTVKMRGICAFLKSTESNTAAKPF